jgi:hypothetical protein
MTTWAPLERLAIFAGPSRPVGLHAGGATLFSPARSGDLRKAADAGYSRIVLADTLFLDAPPNHQEIMEVLDRGIAVYGCSSAGALRAIELAGNGMKGLGITYELYRAGRLRDDAELACVIDDNDHAVTPSLIEIRYYLGHLLTLGAPLQPIARAFEALNSTYYMRRDYAVVNRILAVYPDVDRLQAFRSIEDPAFRLKSIDLENCLADVAVSMQAQAGPFRRADIDTRWLDAGLRLRP